MWQGTLRFALAVAAWATSLGMAQPASAQVADNWVHGKGAFVRSGNGQWQEIYMGKATYRFREQGRDANSVALYDASRGITVRLVDGSAEISSGSASLGSYTGRFFFKEWTYANGGGRFVNTGGRTWQEFQGGRLAYTFTQVGARTTNTITLYDTTRDVKVALSPGQASVLEGDEPRAGISGNWSK